jgi:hypothetical protein
MSISGATIPNLSISMTLDYDIVHNGMNKLNGIALDNIHNT